MHGRIQNYGESCRSLRRISTQHMRSVLPLATTTKKTVAVAGDRHCSLPSPVSTSTVTDSSFVKVAVFFSFLNPFLTWDDAFIKKVFCLDVDSVRWQPG